MSANPYYLAQGYTPRYQFQSFSGAGTLAIYSPVNGSAQVVITGITVASVNGGSMTLGWSYSSAGAKVAEFVMGGSSTVNPVLGAIFGTTWGATLWGSVSGGGSDGFKVTTTAFELPG